MAEPIIHPTQQNTPRRERGTTAYINTTNIAHNLSVFKQLHPGKVIAVVKANAYGHGIEHVVPALKACDAFAVATIEEAIELRAFVTDKKIMLLEGVFNHDEMNTAVDKRFDVVIHQDYQLELLQTIEDSAAIDVWLKIDTGMNRLGFQPNELTEKLAQIETVEGVATVRLMAHFAASDSLKSPQTEKQLVLNTWLNSLGYECSFCNTGGVLNQLNDPDEWARVGLGLYGISPLSERYWGHAYGLKPVMHLTAKIIASKNIPAGSPVGYGGHFTAKTDMRVGILGIGYADGYPWSERTSWALIKGLKTKVIGRVSMDMIAIDLSALAGDLIGSEVTLWGEELPIEAVANDLKLIPYTLCCGISKRVKFDVIQ